jgi:hypothetical protein
MREVIYNFWKIKPMRGNLQCLFSRDKKWLEQLELLWQLLRK